MKVFIPHSVPSLKNGRKCFGGKAVKSKSVIKYLQKVGIKQYSARYGVVGYVRRPNLFEIATAPLKTHLAKFEPPYELWFYFVRGTRHKFDLTNAIALIEDLLTAHRVIPDDSADFFIPHPIQIAGKWYSVDKDNAGVWIFTDSKGG